MRKDLVISRYKEECNWLKEIAPIFDYTVLYNKGMNNITFPGIKIRNTPNVGREAQTWIQYIIDYWDDLGDLIYFLQGSPFSHSENLIDRIKIDYHVPTSLTVRYLVDWPGIEVTKYDLRLKIEGFNVRMGDIRFFGHRPRGITEKWWDGVWSKVFTCPAPKKYYYGYGGMWAVQKDNIKRRGIDFWKYLNEELNHNEEAYVRDLDAWAMEALWNAIWDKPEKYPGRY